MNTAIKQIEEALLLEHRSIWYFCEALEVEGQNTDPQVRATRMLSQALREWASYRESARKEYESLIKQAQEQIKKIDSNHSIWDRYMDTVRVDGYNAKSETQVEMARTASYIIGLSNETLGELFALVTKLQFNK
jgi:hypothetical protein